MNNQLVVVFNQSTYFIKSVSLFALLLFQVPTFAQCDAVLKAGIFDKYSSNTENDVFNSFISWLRKGKFSNHSHVKNTALKYGITLPVDVPIDFNFNGSHGRSKSTSYGEYLANHLTKTTSARNKYQSEIIKANPHVVSAWKDCVVDKRGLVAWTILGANPDEIILVIEYKRYPDPNPKPIYLKSITTGGRAKPSDRITNIQITEKRNEFVFRRADIRKGVTFAIRTNNSAYSNITAKIDPHPSSMRGAEKDDLTTTRLQNALEHTFPLKRQAPFYKAGKQKTHAVKLTLQESFTINFWLRDDSPSADNETNYSIFYLVAPSPTPSERIPWNGIWMYKKREDGSYAILFKNQLRQKNKKILGHSHKVLPSASGRGDGKWYNYSLTYNKGAGSLKFYKNGIEQANLGYKGNIVVSDYLIHNAQLVIGESHNGDAKWNGRIKGFKIYNKVLSKPEMTKIVQMK